MKFELSIRGIDTSLIKDNNSSERKISKEDQQAMDAALKEAKKRKAREYGRTINDKN